MFILNWSNMLFSTIPSGEFKGCKSVDIMGLLNKICKLKISNTNKRMGSLKQDVVCICKEDPLLCVPYHLIKFKNLCPQNQERFYCYKKCNEKN